MAPEVLLRKLTFLRQLLADLEPYRGASLDTVQAEHYKLERIFELLATSASDVLNHLLSEQGVIPESYRAAFDQAATAGLISRDLAGRLQQAAGMRNILVHLYESIDYAILRDSIDQALSDFAQFAAELEPRVEPSE